MDAEDRLTLALAKAAFEQALETGYPSFFDTQINQLAQTVGATVNRSGSHAGCVV